MFGNFKLDIVYDTILYSINVCIHIRMVANYAHTSTRRLSSYVVM